MLRRKALSKKTKLKVMNATMLPTLMYKCEVWNLSKQQESRVQATQRSFEGVSRIDKNIIMVEAGPGRYPRCSKKKTGEVEE